MPRLDHSPVPGRLSSATSTLPLHLGIIPDGNRRWAERTRHTKRDAYRRAAEKAVEVVSWACALGIPRVTAFGISPENVQRRPLDELTFIHDAIVAFCDGAQAIPGIRVALFGDPTALPDWTPRRRELCARTETDPRGKACEVTLVLNHDPARAAIGSPPPLLDLVIRTGGQQRLSGFLPLQSAYAELWFTDRLWPDFTVDDLADALRWYAAQERRLGE